MNLGKAISACRGVRGLSQAELARRIDISPAYLNLIENDKRHPGIDVLNLISGKLEIPLSVLIFLGTQPSDIQELSESELADLTQSIEEVMSRAFPIQPDLEF